MEDLYNQLLHPYTDDHLFYQVQIQYSVYAKLQ